MELGSIEDAFERAAKRPKVSSRESQEVIDVEVAFEIERALSKIHSLGNPMSATDLKPILSELKPVLAAKTKDCRHIEDLGAAVELGKEPQFHSVFVCPVSRDEGSVENPPMLMPCPVQGLHNEAVERQFKAVQMSILSGPSFS